MPDVRIPYIADRWCRMRLRIDLRVRRLAWQKVPSAAENYRKIRHRCHPCLLLEWSLNGSGDGHFSGKMAATSIAGAYDDWQQ
jgi:hypothetical protein